MSKLGILVAAAVGIAAMGLAWEALRSMAAVEVGTAGVLAMVLGGLATVALAAGLVALLFISNRRGFDDRAGGRPDGKTGKHPD